jgi:hypothetical protein
MKSPFIVGTLASLALLGCGSSASSGIDSSSAALSSEAKSTHCEKASDCASGDYCDMSSSKSCGEGTCTAKPFACPFLCEAVCGCDGTTYDNYCDAEQAGTSGAFVGFCEKSPATGCWGGSGGTSCTAATAQTDCNPHGVPGEGYEQGSNGADSNLYCLSAMSDPTLGSCITIPSGCSASGTVCGRDGNTYKSECDAFWIGRVDIASKGACPAASSNAVSSQDADEAQDANAGQDADAGDEGASQDGSVDAGTQDGQDVGSQDGDGGNGQLRDHTAARHGTALSRIYGLIAGQ